MRTFTVFAAAIFLISFQSFAQSRSDENQSSSSKNGKISGETIDVDGSYQKPRKRKSSKKSYGLGSLFYITPTSSLTLESSFNYFTGGYDLLDADGERTDEFDSTGTRIEIAAFYGILDGLDLGLHLGFWPSETLERTPVSTPNDVTETKEKGLEDLSLLGRYRILNNPLYVDLNFKLSPSFSTAEQGDTTDDGNKIRGGHLADIAGHVGMKNGQLEFKGALGFVWNGETEKESPSSSIVTERFDSHLDYYLAGFVRYLASDTFGIGASLKYTLNGSTTFDNPSAGSGIELEYDSHSTIGLGFRSDIKIASDTLLKFGADYAIISETEITADGEIVNSIDSEKELNLNLGIAVQF